MPIRYSRVKVPVGDAARSALETMFTPEELRQMDHGTSNHIARAIRDQDKRRVRAAKAERERGVQIIRVVADLLFGASVAGRVTANLRSLLKGVPLRVERDDDDV